MNLNLEKSTWVNSLAFGGSTSPFIEEGDGFTSERERVRTFLSLVAHADRDRIMVGARNTVDVTVECQVHVGGLAAFFKIGGHQYLQKCCLAD